MLDDVLVPSAFRGLRPEAQLILALSRLRLTADHQDQVHRFLEKEGRNLDWGHFLDQAARHAVLPLVGRNLIRHRLTASDDGRSFAPYRWVYTYVYEGNRARNAALGDEYAKVLRGLNESGIDYAVRKGPVLCEGIYGDIGVRRMGDLDIMLRRDTFPVFESVVSGLGYQQGHQSRDGRQVLPFDRRTRMFWNVNLTNVALPYIKIADRDDVELYILDGCFSLFQASTGIRGDVDEFLSRSAPTTIYGEPSHMLDPIDQIIDSCVQLHVEATTLYYIEIGKDLTLLKFLDLSEILRAAPANHIEVLVDRVREYNCAPSMYYALHHLQQLYPGSVSADLISRFTPADLSYLDEYGGFDGESLPWNRAFADRMFEGRRAGKEVSSVPGPRAVV